MNKLQVELSKFKKRITKVVHKQMNCDRVTISHDEWHVSVHGWLDDDIIASWYTPVPCTIKQVVQCVQHNEG